MNRTRFLTAGAAGALLVVAATSFASPWWTLNRLRAAVERHDAEGVSAQVDFPALRDSVKSQLLGSIARDAGTNAFAAIGHGNGQQRMMAFGNGADGDCDFGIFQSVFNGVFDQVLKNLFKLVGIADHRGRGDAAIFQAQSHFALGRFQLQRGHDGTQHGGNIHMAGGQKMFILLNA